MAREGKTGKRAGPPKPRTEGRIPMRPTRAGGRPPPAMALLSLTFPSPLSSSRMSRLRRPAVRAGRGGRRKLGRRRALEKHEHSVVDRRCWQRRASSRRRGSGSRSPPTGALRLAQQTRTASQRLHGPGDQRGKRRRRPRAASQVSSTSSCSSPRGSAAVLELACSASPRHRGLPFPGLSLRFEIVRLGLTDETTRRSPTVHDAIKRPEYSTKAPSPLGHLCHRT